MSERQRRTIARLSASIAACEAAELSARTLGWEAMAELRAAEIVSLQAMLERVEAREVAA